MTTNTHLLLTGGGTLGPVTPLLSVAQEWRKRHPEALISWIGTPKGPERQLIENARYAFYSLRAPKFDRTRLWTLPFVLPLFAWSCVRAFMLLRSLRPGAVVSAGAYVSVPVAWMAKLLGIPVFIHQLDVVPGLANKLMAPVSKKVTVTFETSSKAFPKKKTEVVGAMVRKFITVGDDRLFTERYGLDVRKPTVLVIGGGTGAVSLNEMMATIGQELEKQANVIHLTGKGKLLPGLLKIGGNYVPLDFLDEGMADAYAVADVVVARAGLGTIAELVALKKPTILVPIMKSHQVANAKALEDKGAAEVLSYVTPQTLLQAMQKLLLNADKRRELSDKISTVFPLNAEGKIVDGIEAAVGVPGDVKL